MDTKEAIERYGKPEIFNTDQGGQFTSGDVTGVLLDAKIKISMDGKGRWIDNRFVERLWRSLKYECVYIHAFEAAARHGSFTKAAELSVTQGAVSAQIANLEETLGIRLFVRSTRQVRLSDQGRGLARACRRAFKDISEEVELLRAGSLDRILTVAVSTFVTTRWLSRRLSSFLDLHSDIAVRFHHSVNEPDFSVENVDLVIRMGPCGDKETCGELWLPVRRRIMCSPKLLDGPKPFSTPMAPD